MIFQLTIKLTKTQLEKNRKKINTLKKENKKYECK